jgi:hypothetical protein
MDLGIALGFVATAGVAVGPVDQVDVSVSTDTPVAGTRARPQLLRITMRAITDAHAFEVVIEVAPPKALLLLIVSLLLSRVTNLVAITHRPTTRPNRSREGVASQSFILDTAAGVERLLPSPLGEVTLQHDGQEDAMVTM